MLKQIRDVHRDRVRAVGRSSRHPVQSERQKPDWNPLASGTHLAEYQARPGRGWTTGARARRSCAGHFSSRSTPTLSPPKALLSLLKDLERPRPGIPSGPLCSVPIELSAFSAFLKPFLWCFLALSMVLGRWDYVCDHDDGIHSGAEPNQNALCW